jgi:acyl carrier protein
MEDKFIMNFKAALEIKGTVSMEDEFRQLPEWDSLSHMSLIAMLDGEYNLQIENATFDKMKTVRDLYHHVEFNSGR